jgi:hypothetical protein
MENHATLLRSLRRGKLVGGPETPSIAPLSGGVSGDGFCVDLAGGALYRGA